MAICCLSVTPHAWETRTTALDGQRVSVHALFVLMAVVSLCLAHTIPPGGQTTEEKTTPPSGQHVCFTIPVKDLPLQCLHLNPNNERTFWPLFFFFKNKKV